MTDRRDSLDVWFIASDKDVMFPSVLSLFVC